MVEVREGLCFTKMIGYVVCCESVNCLDGERSWETFVNLEVCPNKFIMESNGKGWLNS